MKVSLAWLGQYVDIDGLSPQAIAEALTASGLEVEAIETIGAVFQNIVVGKVLAVEKHPNADKLSLVTVDAGKGEPEKVVCGAQNLRVPMLIPFGFVGSQVVSRKDGSLFTLEKAKIRGVESCGMICSLDELGLLDDYEKKEEGIWPLDGIVPESTIGQPLEQALGLKRDVILETAPTANRGDLMSMFGVAREVAALFDRKLTLPTTEAIETRLGQLTQASQPNVELIDPSVCGYYGGLLMKGLKIKPSPEWMVSQLKAAGVRSISNVVDITNFVMLEMGQPLHAFDADKLGHEGTVGVRRAREGESLVTLDSIERPLTSEAVIITMNDQPVAMAGLMGGETTEISDESTELFLEGAFFNPAAVRRSAKSVGLRTEASARFERGVDPGTTRKALFRAAQLLEELADAQLIGLVESPLPDTSDLNLTLRLPRMERILGMTIDKASTTTILTKLGFGCSDGAEPDTLTVAVPSFRQADVSREIDLIEEVIRVYGYDRVQYTLPDTTQPSRTTKRAAVLEAIRNTLEGAGLQEVMTSSLIGSSWLEQLGLPLDERQTIRLTNTYSDDYRLMRQSVIPSLLDVAQYNKAQGTADVWVYELGRTYHKTHASNDKVSGVREALVLAGLLTGNPRQGQWKGQASSDFYTAKGVVEQLLEALGLLSHCRFEPEESHNALHPGKTARIVLKADGKTVLGRVGELHPMIQEAIKFRQPVYLLEFAADALLKAINANKTKPEPIRLSPFPPVTRDMAFVAPISVSHQAITELLAKQSPELIREITLFDDYRNPSLGDDKRSLAYRVTLQSDTETLRDEQIDGVMQTLRQSLQDAFAVTLR